MIFLLFVLASSDLITLTLHILLLVLIILLMLTVIFLTPVFELGRVMMNLHVLFCSDLSRHHSFGSHELKFISFKATLVVITSTCPLVVHPLMVIMIGHSISFIDKMVLLVLHDSHMSLLLLRCVIRKDALSVTLSEHR